jgi:hypothetical protein
MGEMIRRTEILPASAALARRVAEGMTAAALASSLPAVALKSASP